MAQFLAWLHVDERKPPEDVELFVEDAEGKYHVAKWNGHSWRLTDSNKIFFGVRYWALMEGGIDENHI
jgi:hypothetical protein